MNLTGTWVSDGYNCPRGTKHTEIVTITHDGDHISGTKVTGDDCVPAGNATFSGTVDLGVSTATVTWVVGHSWAPASGRHPGTLSIVSENTFLATAPGWREMCFRRLNIEAPWRPVE